MTIRAWRVALIGASTIAALVVAVHVSAAGPVTRVDASVLAKVSKLPPGLDTTPVTVVVVLSGDPVATVQEAAGRRLSRGEKDGVKSQRRNEQSAVTSQILAAGGKIVGTFQSAVNGIKVQIPSNKIGALRQIVGVVDVKGVNTYQRDNVVGIPRVQAPAVWAGVPHFRGERMKVAIIDTGIDYTHANFGGPGTVAAFDAAFAASTSPASPALFGPLAPKVKGGIDLVGDDYNANDPASIPHPDPNPLDCNGHGSHVAGTAAGLGVKSDGTTYTGPYDATTYANSFRIGPGVAPKAELYAVRVFGCSGSTNVVVDALDWAVDHDMDVVNMSLGSDYGTSNSADALASDNAAKAGVIVVAASGNSGDLRYVTSTPASSSRSISVAATETIASFPTANMALPAAGGDLPRTIVAINANGFAYGSTFSGMVKVVRDGPTTTDPVSLGCSLADFQANGGVVGKIAVVNRGTCARVSKAIYGQQAGAVAVIMVNNVSDVLPPYEGQILSNPDNGDPYIVTIPFLGVKGTTDEATSDGSRLVLRDGLPTSFAPGATLPSSLASFSSGGPRNGDSVLKPDISAPGSPIFSTLIGSGNEGFNDFGTSMATPHVAGVAALVQQAHPKWRVGNVKAAIVNSGEPGAIGSYATHSAGSGFVNAASAAHTQVTAYADDKLTSMSFGLVEFQKNFTKDQKITLHNDGNAATFNVAAVMPQGSPHTVALDRTQVRVKAHDDADVRVTLNVPAATAGNSDDFRDVAGLIVFTPASASDNGGIALRVPYYLVPRVSTNVEAKLDKPVKASSPSGVINLTNKGSAIAATADFYSWGLDGKGNGSGKKNPIINLASAGVQSFPISATDQLIVFAINTEEAWSSPSTREFDVAIDLNGDGIPDYYVVAIDLGLITTGFFNGQMVTVVYDSTYTPQFLEFSAYAPYDSSTILLPVLAADIGITPASPRFSYKVAGYDLVQTMASDSFTSWAKYNAFGSAITDGQYIGPFAPNATAAVPFTVNTTELALTPALGLMVVTQDNKNGTDEANLVRIEVTK
jgi:subtilisin family serine protease